MEFNVPGNLWSIKLGQYQKYISEAEGIGEQTYKANPRLLEAKALEIFCGVENARKLPLEAYDLAINSVNKCFEEEPEFTQRFSMVGTDGAEIEFGLIPNFDKMTTGEYMDLDNYINDWSNMHRAMAVMYRPIDPKFKGKKDYRILDYNGSDVYADIMKEMPVSVALAARVFFYNLGKELLSRMTSYLQHSGETLSEEQKRLFLASMDGITAFMGLQTEKHSMLRPLPDYQSTLP